MLEILVAVGPLAFLLVLSEILWRARLLRGESARKMLHIIIGSYVASWLYFLTFEQIQIISVAMMVGVAISHKYHIFHAITDVKRKTWGDIFYSIGIFLTATLTHQPWIFALAILHMSIADGLAGLLGSRFGSTTQYKVLGCKKSWVGTGSFILASLVILVIFAGRHAEITTAYVLLVPIFAAVLENIGARGTDNILIPLCIVLLFR